MRRFYLSLALFALLVGICGYSLFQVNRTRTELTQRTAAIDQLLAEDRDNSQLEQACLDLKDFWDGEMTILIRYVRHGELDSIAESIARLSALCEKDDRGQLRAELILIETTIDHIWFSELPLPRNIL